MREDIVAGLKNALDRGVSLERAVQSFINAGYNPIEVKQAAQSLTEGFTSITNPDVYNRQKMPEPMRPQLNSMNNQQQPFNSSANQPRRLSDIRQMPQTKKSSGKVILIIVLFVILLLLIGGLVYMILYGQELINSILNK